MKCQGGQKKKRLTTIHSFKARPTARDWFVQHQGFQVKLDGW